MQLDDLSDIFERAFSLILELEGGYHVDPDDPGGETKYGISKRAYPNLDIKNLTVAQANSIYFHDYWSASGCSEIARKNPGAAIAVFDCAVNQGVSVAKRMWRQLEIRSDALEMFMTARAVRYMKTKNADKYLNGWLKRLFVVSIEIGRG